MAANAAALVALNSQASRDLSNMQSGVGDLLKVGYHKWDTQMRNTGVMFQWDVALYDSSVEAHTQGQIDAENLLGTTVATKNRLDRRNAAALITRSIGGHPVEDIFDFQHNVPLRSNPRLMIMGIGPVMWLRSGAAAGR